MNEESVLAHAVREVRGVRPRLYVALETHEKAG